jgi:hypothetical protein
MRVSSQPGFPVPNYRHLADLTDSTAVFEHAWFCIPRWEHGYCIDDNARALMVCSRATWTLENTADLHRISRCALSFIRAATLGGCPVRTRIDHQRRWIDEGPVGDTDGRTLWALGVASTHHPSRDIRVASAELFAEIAPSFSATYPRSVAFACLGAIEALHATPKVAREFAQHLSSGLARPQEDDSWPWPEPRLTYANATLCEALIATGGALDDGSMVDDGVRMLNWLFQQEWTGTHFSFTRHTGRGRHDLVETHRDADQQPIESAAMADACWRAWTVTGDQVWAERTLAAAAWFLGDNDAGLTLYDHETGATADGLHADNAIVHVNMNCGAESTLAALSALQRAASITESSRQHSESSGADHRERRDEFSLTDNCGPNTSVSSPVNKVDPVVVQFVDTLDKDHVINIANALPGKFGFHDGSGQHGPGAASVGVEQRHIHCVNAVGSSLVEKQEQPNFALQRWCAGTDAQTSRSRADNHVIIKLFKMLFPIALVRVPQIVDAVEHRNLHVGMDPVHKRNPAIGEVEHHRVFVGKVCGPEHPFTRVVDDKPVTQRVEYQPVRADLPWSPRPLVREPCVGHDQVLNTIARNQLHPRVFDGIDVAFAAQQDRVKGVPLSVIRSEQQHVADVVKETGTTLFGMVGITSIPISDAAHEQMKPAVVLDQAGVEQRAVPNRVSGLKNRFFAQALSSGPAGGWRGRVVSQDKAHGGGAPTTARVVSVSSVENALRWMVAYRYYVLTKTK